MFISGFKLNRDLSQAERVFSMFIVVMTDPQTMLFSYAHEMAWKLK